MGSIDEYTGPYTREQVAKDLREQLQAERELRDELVDGLQEIHDTLLPEGE